MSLATLRLTTLAGFDSDNFYMSGICPEKFPES